MGVFVQRTLSLCPVITTPGSVPFGAVAGARKKQRPVSITRVVVPAISQLLYSLRVVTARSLGSMREKNPSLVKPRRLACLKKGVTR